MKTKKTEPKDKRFKAAEAKEFKAAAAMHKGTKKGYSVKDTYR